MTLKIRNKKQIITWAIWGIIVLALVIFLIRIAVFEANYYSKKEGSFRAIIDTVDIAEEPVDETKPTEEEIRSYVVAPDLPRYLSIDSLNIKNAKVIQVGVKSDKKLGTPNNIYDVGWYNGSKKPGENGTMVFDAHSGGPSEHGIFKNLPEVPINDIIKIERGDGATFYYKVVENKAIPLDEADKYMRTAFRSPELGKSSITLITCSGEWSNVRKTYLSRQFVRAVLVES